MNALTAAEKRKLAFCCIRSWTGKNAILQPCSTALAFLQRRQMLARVKVCLLLYAVFAHFLRLCFFLSFFHIFYFARLFLSLRNRRYDLCIVVSASAWELPQKYPIVRSQLPPLVVLACRESSGRPIIPSFSSVGPRPLPVGSSRLFPFPPTLTYVAVPTFPASRRFPVYADHLQTICRPHNHLLHVLLFSVFSSVCLSTLVFLCSAMPHAQEVALLFVSHSYSHASFLVSIFCQLRLPSL